MRTVAARHLRLEQLSISERHFLLEHPCLQDDEILTCVALLIYATYTVTNHCRHNHPISHEVACDALQQACRNGAQGHAAACNILDGRW
eukprot:4792415-Karenia_brevis.AAC.1